MTSINFYRPSSTIDKLICFFSRGGYCHCNITVNGDTYEAAPFGKVRQFQLEPSISRIESFTIELTTEQELALISFLFCQLGKGYDYFSIFGFILYQNDRPKYGRWFCSELVFAALRKVGVPLLKRIEPFKVSPVILSTSPLI